MAGATTDPTTPSMALPADLQAKLDAAEAAFQTAQNKDATRANTLAAVQFAQAADTQAMADALAAHQTATTAANDALVAVLLIVFEVDPCV